MYNFITEYNLMNSRGPVKVIWAASSYFHLAPISMVQKLCTFIIPSLHCPCSFYLCVIYWSYRLQTLEHRNKSVFVTFSRIMNNNSEGKLVIFMFFSKSKVLQNKKATFLKVWFKCCYFTFLLKPNYFKKQCSSSSFLLI